MNIARLDKASTKELAELRSRCRFSPGYVWMDDQHMVACVDSADRNHVLMMMSGRKAQLAFHDPPYNFAASSKRSIDDYVDWCRSWIAISGEVTTPDSALYVWLGADQKNGFRPLPEFMMMMRDFDYRSRSFITWRGQRGKGTQKNWMAVRQELLYYARGDPTFHVQYTRIPRVLKGLKDAQGRTNCDRSLSPNIRSSNVWVDVQQVFWRMRENVGGCYAQKPLATAERVIQASTDPGDLVVDFFCHSGTTLLAAERLGRRCVTFDKDPIYCELAVRRLCRYREKGLLGWAEDSPFDWTAEERITA